ncbi:Glycerate 2-kinase [Ephemeroptericola cinctiostellae]|uniref:Glycerate 2-kinase n=1 Tax=Ephemeroptericola cinctiostellae TaxID=2268024 RepID=A0A345DC04_9BURK|nr:glycerate kinase [Ephemeroptericola cinctiostellae]AXF85892.1 Glycerate 2-kinase [Ephemeroptericola cinctiostellae]
MKIVIAPDSFKESLSAMDVATAIEDGFKEIFPQAHYIKIPVADGGEGTVRAIIDATGGRMLHQMVTGPLGQPVDAFYGLTGDGQTAVIEMAAASGLELVLPEQRNPMLATSFGVGELILDALELGVSRFVLGVGGSATNDGGAGMLQALGIKLLDDKGEQIAFGGAGLADLQRIDVSTLDPRVAHAVFEIACDVTNPLVGPMGASVVFGPQKGASSAMIEQLDCNLRHFAACIRRDTGIDVLSMEGAGAGGGISAAMMVFLNGHLRPGSEMVMDAVGLTEAMGGADLVITGEGRLDGQTIHGKTPIGVARVAQRLGVPVVAMAGCFGEGARAIHEHGIDAAFSIVSRPCTVPEALSEAQMNVRTTARNVAAALAMGMRLTDHCNQKTETQK